MSSDTIEPAEDRCGRCGHRRVEHWATKVCPPSMFSETKPAWVVLPPEPEPEPDRFWGVFLIYGLSCVCALSSAVIALLFGVTISDTVWIVISAALMALNFIGIMINSDVVNS